MIKPSFDLVAAEETLAALDSLADDRGKKWKAQAFKEAGLKAFLPIVNGAVRLAPARTGLTRASLYHTKPIYNASNAKILTPTGKIRAKAKNEYHIATTIDRKFNSEFPLDSNGKRIRYPFIQEVGVERGTYVRGGYFNKNGTRVRVHKYERTAGRNPLLFMHKSLYNESDKSVKEWTRIVKKYIEAYSKTTYATSKAAIAAVERRAATGRYTKSKWK